LCQKLGLLTAIRKLEGGVIGQLTQKQSGAYYTPDGVVSTLLQWAVRSSEDRLIDPACGDGRFIAGHRNAVGIEQDEGAARGAMARAPWALVHEGDFFAWAAETTERFDCAAGNPPFIRYQHFSGATRARALELCRQLGPMPPRLTLCPRSRSAPHASRRAAFRR
jgi:adenine-specific DNA-methyltransferase